MSDFAKLKVMLVEDSFLARLGTTAFLGDQPDLEIVGFASDGLEAVAKYPTLMPDVVVCDLKMPNLDGVGTIVQLVRLDPGARVLVLTHYQGDENILRALKAGARGYLTKDTSGDDLIAAIRAVAAGRRYFPPEIGGRLAERMMQPELTPRDLQLLRAIYEGLSNADIGVRLGLTQRTVGIYVSRVMSKLGAHNRTEAVRLAIERGVLDPNAPG